MVTVAHQNALARQDAGQKGHQRPGAVCGRHKRRMDRRLFRHEPRIGGAFRVGATEHLRPVQSIQGDKNHPPVSLGSQGRRRRETGDQKDPGEADSPETV